jgi:hypothetical protein
MAFKPETFDVKGKTAIVTGAGSGSLFAPHGISVAYFSRYQLLLRQTATGERLQCPFR